MEPGTLNDPNLKDPNLKNLNPRDLSDARGNFAGNESCVEALSELFDRLEEAQRIGTLKLSSNDGRRTVYIYFNRGSIQYAKTTQYRTLLGRALVKRGRLSESQLESALQRQRAAPRGMRLGQILIGSGLVTRDDIQKALAFQMAEEIFSCFIWDGFSESFYRGEPPLDIFDEEDREFRVALRPSQLAQEARRRSREMAAVRKLISSDHDVCVLTLDSQLLGESGGERELIAFLDGRRDVEEFLEALPAPDFVGLRILARLLNSDHAARLDGDQLVTLGRELEESGDYERAKKRYRRAAELGHSDFELSRRLGQVEEALGRGKDACRCYVEYAEQCQQHNFTQVAIETLRHAISLDEQDLEARKSLAQLLESAEQTEAALAEWRKILERVDQATIDRDELIQLWAQIGRLEPEDLGAHRKLAELYLESGDRTQAFMELQELATLTLSEGLLEDAVPVLRQAHELDPDEIMVHESLATTLARLGQRDEAIREFMTLAENLARSDTGGIFKQHLTTIYEKIVGLDPSHGAARVWLAQAHEEKANSSQAVANYKELLPKYRTQGDDEKLLEILAKIYKLDPSDTENSREYATILAKGGRGAEGVKVLTGLAEAAQAESQSEKANELFAQILTIDPSNLTAHKAQARSDDDKPRAARRLHAISTLIELAGKHDEARDILQSAVELDGNNVHLRLELIRALLSSNRGSEAVKHYLKVARKHRENQDLGSARRLLEKIIELEPEHADARQILKELSAKPAAKLAIEPSQPAAPERPQPKPMPTITGGGQAQVTVVGGTKRLSSVNKLRSMLYSKGEDESLGGEEVASEEISAKAAKGINRLKALRGGGGAPGEDSGAMPRPVSAGPEAPGQALEPEVAQKAAKGINRLKALRGGGGSPNEESGSMPRPISQGPEAPGQALEPELAQKAAKGINRLKALRGGGEDAAPAARPISAGPEAPGQALEPEVAQKAAKGINRLKALRGGDSASGSASASGLSAGPATGPGPAISAGPEAPGQALEPELAQKAAKGINRLKALRGGDPGTGSASGANPGSNPGPNPRPAISAGPEAPGQALEPELAQKAAKGINRLKALRGGGGSPSEESGSMPRPISQGPEAPGQALEPELAQKATKGINRLKALRGGGDAPAAAKPAISKGPEAPGEALSEDLARKASQGINRLKALKLGQQPAAD